MFLNKFPFFIDQPDDGLEKRPKHVVVPKIRYVNKAP
jgi:hypothetical protein